MQFCQVLFLNNYICDIIVLDKIGNRVYNVHRNPQGSLYIYTQGKYTFPPRVFQGILSEYLALKCSPIVVYMDLGYFLVTGYILYMVGGWYPAYPLCFLGFVFGFLFMVNLKPPEISLNKNWFTL